jgi:hypothetical protein
MRRGLNTRKPIDQLKPQDLVAFPIWEFASDEEEVDGQDETWVRPVEETVVRKGLWSLSVAADFRTRSGAEFPGLVSVSTAEGVELGHGAVLAHDKYIFVGSGALFDGSQVASELNLPIGDVFPLAFTLKVLVTGEKRHRTGTFG